MQTRAAAERAKRLRVGGRPGRRMTRGSIDGPFGVQERPGARS